MRIKRDCGCGYGGKDVTDTTLKSYLFYVIQQANKNGKDRAIILENDELTDVQKEIAIGYNKNIVGLVPAGLKSVNELSINI